jgi:hypothetical protein
MSKQSAKNNELLKNSKVNTSPKIYSILLKLVNDDKEDLAEIVLKVDYLLEYTSTCIKQRDYKEAKESLSKAKSRIDDLKRQGISIEYLEYLYEGIAKKAKI